MSSVSKDENFGKDLGLMSEVVVAARKAGMTRNLWGRFAHDPRFMKEVVQLASEKRVSTWVSPLSDISESVLKANLSQLDIKKYFLIADRGTEFVFNSFRGVGSGTLSQTVNYGKTIKKWSIAELVECLSESTHHQDIPSRHEMLTAATCLVSGTEKSIHNNFYVRKGETYYFIFKHNESSLTVDIMEFFMIPNTDACRAQLVTPDAGLIIEKDTLIFTSSV